MAYDDDEEYYAEPEVADDTEYEEQDVAEEPEPTPVAAPQEDDWEPYKDPTETAAEEPEVKLPDQYAAADTGIVSDAAPVTGRTGLWKTVKDDDWEPYVEPKAAAKADDWEPYKEPGALDQWPLKDIVDPWKQLGQGIQQHFKESTTQTDPNAGIVDQLAGMFERQVATGKLIGDIILGIPGAVMQTVTGPTLARAWALATNQDIDKANNDINTALMAFPASGTKFHAGGVRAPPVEVPRAAPPAQGELPGIGSGGRQMELPLERPAEPPTGGQRELPLEPPPVDAQGQLGFNIEAPQGVGVPRTTFEEGKFTTEATSRPAMPDTGGVAKESTPPVGDRSTGDTRYGKETLTVEEPGSGINVLQPGQVDPTLRGGLQARTAEAPRAEPAPPTRFEGQFKKEPPPRAVEPPVEQPAVRSSTPEIDEAVVRATAPEPAAPPAAPTTVKNLGEQLKERAAAEQAAKVVAASEIDLKLANRVLNQPRVLRQEAAKRGMTPEALKAQAQEAIQRSRVQAEPVAPARPVEAAPVEPVAAPKAAPAAAEDLTIPDFLRRTSEAKRQAAERGRSGRPIRTAPLKIGAEPRILEAGFKKATGPKEYPKEIEDIVSKYMRKEATAAEVQKAFKDRGWTVDLRRGRYDVEAFDPSGRQHYIQGAERQGPAGKPQVKTHDGAVFTGDTVHAAAAYAKGAGYRPHQIFEASGKPYEAPRAAAAAPPGGPPREPPVKAAPPVGGAPPPPQGPATSVAGSRERIRAKIASSPPWHSKIPTSRAEAKDLWRRFYTSTKNSLDPIEQLTKLKEKPIDPAADFSKLARLTKGLGGRFTQLMRDGTYDIRTGKVNGKSLDEVIKPIQNSPQEFTDYALSKRTIELEGRGIKTGMPLADAHAIVAADAAKFEPVFRDLVAFQDRVLQNLVHSGILSESSAAKMRQLNKEYVPFYRLLDPKSELGQQLGSGLQTKNPIYKIKGSEREVFDPIDSIIKNTYAYTDLAERNRAMVEMKKFNDGLPEGKRFMVQDRLNRPIEVQPGEIQRFMDKHGIEGFADDAMTIFRPKAFQPEPGKIRLYENGKPQVYKVPEAIGTAVNAMDRQSLDLFTKILSTPAKLLRAGAVLSPEFMLRNPLRDMLTSFIQSKHGSIPVYDFVIGLKEIFKRSKEFQEWQINGGANANLVSMDRKILNMDAKSLAGKVGNVVTKPYHWLQMLSELSENATRVGVYKRAVGKGVHPVEAAYEAREASLDFARMGSSPAYRAANSLIPFFNAQIEGVDRAARAFRDNPFGTTAKVAASITAPSVALWFNNKDDERVQQLAQWQKDLFWIVPTNNWVPMSAAERAKFPEDVSKLKNTIRQAPDGSWQRNNGTLWRIPKPFELGVLFGSVPERMLDAYYNHNPNAFKNLDTSIERALTPGFIPQAALPFIEQFANRSIFLDRPLLTEKQEKLPPAQQVAPFTSETAKVAGQVVRAIAGDKSSFGSPIMIDNYIRQWSGGLGQYVVQGIDKAIKSQQDKPTAPTADMADVPGIKAFVARFPSSQAQAIKDFYDERKDRQTEQAGIKDQRKSDPTGAAERMQKSSPYTGDPFAKILAGDRDAVGRIMADRTMSADDKRAALDLTYLIMIEHAKRGIETFERTKRREPAAVQ